MRIYLDHNATTPIRPEVVEAMTQVLQDDFGNPSSLYVDVSWALELVEVARAQVAGLLGVDCDAVAGDHVEIGLRVEGLVDALHGPRKQHVVGVDPIKDVPGAL